MVKKYKPRVKRVLPLRKKEGNNMPATLKKEENEQIHDNLTIFQAMVLSPTKRQEIYNYYDNNYKETEEDKNFFKAIKNKRRLEE